VYFYQAYGLGIHSELPLFDLPVQKNIKKDVMIYVDDIPVNPSKDISADPYERVTPQEAVYSIDGVGRFRVLAGREIAVHPAPESDQWQAQRYLLGLAMAFLLYQRGRLVLHASAISMDGYGVAFLGDSGAGKSSIASAFLAQGHKLVVDDITSIAVNSSSAWIDPGFPYIKLSIAAKEMVALNPEHLEFMDFVDDKASYRIGRLASNERIQLNNMYVIQPGDEVGLERFNSQQALFELMRYSIPVRMVRMNHVAHFERCVELLKYVQVYGLRRPQSLSQLSRLVNLVEENISQLEQ
jgi:hypothetical protein